MLVPPHIEVAQRLCGEPIRWSDYARSILKQAHESFSDYGSGLGTGPWYIVCTMAHRFKMIPIVEKDYYHSFDVRPSYDSECWIFEVLP